MSTDQQFLDQAIRLAEENLQQGGHPFGALVVREGVVVATGVNEMHLSADPTAHAETVALRRACAALNTLRLPGATIYASGHPCPMCMAAMRMAGITRVVYAYSNSDAEPFGLSTAHVAADLRLPESRQKMQIEHIPWRRIDQPHLYELWQQTGKNSG